MLRFEIPQRKTLTLQLMIPIRWGDMDTMGHVNNASYFRYFEILRVAWLDALGYSLNREGEGPALVNVFCNFYKQLKYPGDLLARHYVCNPGRSSIDTFMTLERADMPEKLFAAGGGRLVWFDYVNGVSRNLPQSVRDLALACEIEGTEK